MKYYTDENVFEQEMKKIKSILERNGCVLESDHHYAYNMQYGVAFRDVSEWLINNGYKGKLNTLGCYEGVAVYGLYDPDRVSYDEMLEKLKREAEAPLKEYI